MNSEQYNIFKDSIISEKAASALLHSKEYKNTDTVSFVNGFRKGADWALLRLKSAFFEVVDNPTEQTDATDPNAAYNEKCRKIAEMIAKDILEDIWERMSAESNEYRIERRMPISRAIVAEMEKEVRCAYTPVVGMLTTNVHLIQRGLIPNTKTDDNADK